MNPSELRSKSVDELRTEIVNLRKEQFSLKMQAATQQLQKGHLIRNVRKNIAKAKTILAEKEKGVQA